MRWALGHCDVVVSNAIATARRVEALCGYRMSKITVIPNGVEPLSQSRCTKARLTIRRQLGIFPDDVVIGSVGRLVEVKHFGLAIDAIAELRHRGLSTHLLLVGDGPMLAALRSHACSREIAQYVHFCGHQADVGRFLSAMDIYANSSISEGLSQSLIEALAAGLPIVVTDVGDSRRVAESLPTCGLVVPPGNVGAFAHQLACLASDSALRCRMARASAQKHSEEFSVEKMAATYSHMYRRLLAERNQTEAV